MPASNQTPSNTSASASASPSPSSPTPSVVFTHVHPYFTYSTRSPLPPPSLAQRVFPSPFVKEPDFTASPPLEYAVPSPVEVCIDAHFTKYPHPSCPDYVASKIVEDRTDEHGVRHRKRMIYVNNVAPWIFRKFVGSTDVLEFEEHSTYDPRARQFILHSQNNSYQNIVYAKEASLFQPHPSNPDHTHFVQYGGIRCSSYFGYLKRPLEKFVCKRMIQGGLQATQLLDEVLQQQNPFNS